MSGVKICKGDNYFLLTRVHFAPFKDGKIRPYESIYLTLNDGEGMELKEDKEAKLYDAIDKFFQEYM